ncbi:MAG: hypothetical protein KAW47_03960 [Thermoplasmatales archaeon]|nr:hypothetical protein [Thermoplasmatales archaeon]
MPKANSANEIPEECPYPSEPRNCGGSPCECECYDWRLKIRGFFQFFPRHLSALCVLCGK